MMEAFLMSKGEGSRVELVVIAPKETDFYEEMQAWRLTFILKILDRCKFDHLTRDEYIACEDAGLDMMEYHHSGRTEDNWGCVWSMWKPFLKYLKTTYETMLFNELFAENYPGGM